MAGIRPVEAVWSRSEQSFEGTECRWTIWSQVGVGIEELDFVAGVVGEALTQGRSTRKGHQNLEGLAETNPRGCGVAQMIETT